MRLRTIALLPLMLAACGPTAPTVPQLVLQPILYFDVAQNKLYDSGCNFVPANGGMGAVFLAMADRGVIKLNERIVALPLASDAGQLAQSAHRHYTGGGYSATIAPMPGGQHKQLGVVSVFTGHLLITDTKGQVVYDATGDTQCKPM